MVPSAGVSILAVHGFRNTPVYLYSKLPHWRASLEEVLVLTSKENIHQGGWKNRQLQLREHLLNNPLPFTHSGIHLLSRFRLNKTLCSKRQYEPNQWSALSTTLIHPTVLKGSIPWGKHPWDVGALLGIRDTWDRILGSPLGQSLHPGSRRHLQTSTDVSHLAYIKL